MNYQDFIGWKLEDVTKILSENNIKFEIVETKSNKQNFDTIIVTNVKKAYDKILLITDKFLLYI